MKKFTWNFLMDIIHSWSDSTVENQAAALAFYTIFSLAPLLLISISLVGLIFSKEAVQHHVLNQISSTLGPESAKQITVMLDGTHIAFNNYLATVIGIIVLIFGATGFFQQLQKGLNSIWKAPVRQSQGFRNAIKERLLSFTMVLGIAFLLLVSLILSTAAAVLGVFFGDLLKISPAMLLAGNLIVSQFFITVLFAMIYKVLPRASVKWRTVWPSAFLTALFFTLGKFILSFYLSTVDVTSSYGAAGSFIIILIWVYYTARILFFGAKLTTLHRAYRI